MAKMKSRIQERRELVRAFFMMCDDFLAKNKCPRESGMCKARKRCDDCTFDYYFEKAKTGYCWMEMETGKLITKKRVTATEEDDV